MPHNVPQLADRTTMNWSPNLASIALSLGLIEKDEKVIVGGPSIEDRNFDQLQRSISTLLTMMCNVFRDDFSSDVVTAAHALGVPQSECDILRIFDEPITDLCLARADLVYYEGTWKLLELNIGSTVGGMFYSSLPRLSGFTQTTDALEAWATNTQRIFGINGPTAIVEDSRYVSYVQRAFPACCKALSARTGNRVVICSHSELRWDGSSLSTREGEIEFLYRLFVPSDVLAAKKEYEAILDAMSHKRVKCPMGPKYNLINNKGMLAYLWSKYDRGELAGEEARIVRDLVTPTWWLDDFDLQSLISSRSDYIVKPSQGSCGIGILNGLDHSIEEWKHLMDEVLHSSSAKTYVVQPYLPPESANVVLAGTDGSLENRMCDLVWGIYVYDQSYIGGFIRAQQANSGSIINYAQGAVTGPLPPSSFEVVSNETR